MADTHAVAQEFAQARAEALDSVASLLGDINYVYFGERAPSNGDPMYAAEVVEALADLYNQAITDTVQMHLKHGRKPA